MCFWMLHRDFGLLVLCEFLSVVGNFILYFCNLHFCISSSQMWDAQQKILIACLEESQLSRGLCQTLNSSIEMEERSKFVHSEYSRDELVSVRPSCLTPDLAARLRSLDIGFCLPRRRTRRGGEKESFKKISVVSCPRTDHARSSKATDQGLCELGCGGNLLNLINVNTNQRQTFLRICCFDASVSRH